MRRFQRLPRIRIIIRLSRLHNVQRWPRRLLWLNRRHRSTIRHRHLLLSFQRKTTTLQNTRQCLWLFDVLIRVGPLACIYLWLYDRRGWLGLAHIRNGRLSVVLLCWHLLERLLLNLVGRRWGPPVDDLVVILLLITGLWLL